jgi:hypothetical protein
MTSGSAVWWIVTSRTLVHRGQAGLEPGRELLAGGLDPRRGQRADRGISMTTSAA